MRRLVQKATSQQGLLSTGQLRELGVSRGVQAGLVKDGVLETSHRGVYRLAGSPSTWLSQLWAAVLAPGAAKVVSHRSALRLWGLRTLDEEIEVTVRYPGSCRLAGLVTHRSVDLKADDVVALDGLPVTTIERTLCDAGLIFPPGEVQRMVDHAAANGLVTAKDLLAFRRRVGEHGRNGVVALETAVEHLPADVGSTDSSGEVALLRLIERAGLRPGIVIQYPITVAGQRRVLDLAYPDERLAIEYDGKDVHTRVDRFVDDRRRQNALVHAGWTVLRFTADDVRTRPIAVAAEIRRALGRRPGDL
ncbi:MAG: type IV toxin-antitoxin system AbiEi family antitoxin domain-containing protein [Actinomycetota bacterium]